MLIWAEAKVEEAAEKNETNRCRELAKFNWLINMILIQINLLPSSLPIKGA